MKKPKESKPYCFVRATPSGYEHTEFTRFADGSASFAAEGMHWGYDNDSNAWVQALEALQAMGFTELGEARSTGLVPMEWEPSSLSHVVASLRSE